MDVLQWTRPHTKLNFIKILYVQNIILYLIFKNHLSVNTHTHAHTQLKCKNNAQFAGYTKSNIWLNLAKTSVLFSHCHYSKLPQTWCSKQHKFSYKSQKLNINFKMLMGLHALQRLKRRICPFLPPPCGTCRHLLWSLYTPGTQWVPDVILIHYQQVLVCTKSLLPVRILVCFTQIHDESFISRLDVWN